MKTNFEPKRLTQARALKMFNMTELAERVGLTRQTISQYEKGLAPSEQKLRELSNVLDVSERFFTRPLSSFEKNQNDIPSFRSMSSASAAARKQALSFLELSAFIIDNLTNYVQLPGVKVPNFDIKDFENLSDSKIEDIAIKTRKYFGLGNGPISNITLLMENHGVVISNVYLHKGLDALCSWFNERPFVLASAHGSAVRVRYNLAHELGHLVLHKNLLDISDIENRKTLKLIEHQANYFAGSFLMPEASFGSEVYGLSIESLVSLKQRWGVSIAAMVKRLHHLDIINENKKSRMFSLLNSKNMKRNEPLDDVIKKEIPRLFSKIVSVLRATSSFSVNDLKEITALRVKLLSTLTAIPECDLYPSASLDNVVALRR